MCLPEVGELDGGRQKLQNPSYRINKEVNKECNVQHDKYNEHCCVLCMKVKRVNPKSYHHKEKFFFYFFNFIPIWDDGCWLNLLW